MDNSITLSCQIGTTDPTAKIGMEVWLDDLQIFNTDHVDGTVEISHKVNDAEAEHEIRFIMKNKQMDHTQVDDSGNIVSDACLTIQNLAFDGIELGHTVVEQAVYHHDFNGTQAAVEDQFFGSMGCNGTVSLKFTTPIYLWLLEHL